MFLTCLGDIIDSPGLQKLQKKESKEYYRDNPQGVEEEVSIKADEIETLEPVVTEEVKDRKQPNLEASKAFLPQVELLFKEVTETEAPRQRTRDDGTTLLGSRIFQMDREIEENSDV